MTATLVNGVEPLDPAHAIAGDDRGLHYGDGLFETALYKEGAVRFLDLHLERLRTSCTRLGIAYPEETLLRADIRAVCGSAREGVLKIVLTRGAGGRGYRPAPDLRTTRLVMLSALPPMHDRALNLRWCETRLGRNALLAGMKHLNRLEQVLAQREWQDAAIDEGLMLDTEGEVVCGTMNNLFLVSENTLVTPDLRFCGVRGVMRGEVLRIAKAIGIPARAGPLWPQDLATADEVFITNAVRGVRSVSRLDSTCWVAGPITKRIAAEVQR